MYVSPARDEYQASSKQERKRANQCSLSTHWLFLFGTCQQGSLSKYDQNNKQGSGTQRTGAVDVVGRNLSVAARDADVVLHDLNRRARANGTG